MADEHRSDDDVLVDLEQSLAQHDPDLNDRSITRAAHPTGPIRMVTFTWLIWTSTWFIAYLATGNSAALVLAGTSALAFPLGLGAVRWCVAEHNPDGRRRDRWRPEGVGHGTATGAAGLAVSIIPLESPSRARRGPLLVEGCWTGVDCSTLVC